MTEATDQLITDGEIALARAEVLAQQLNLLELDFALLPNVAMLMRTINGRLEYGYREYTFRSAYNRITVCGAMQVRIAGRYLDEGRVVKPLSAQAYRIVATLRKRPLFFEALPTANELREALNVPDDRFRPALAELVAAQLISVKIKVDMQKLTGDWQ